MVYINRHIRVHKALYHQILISLELKRTFFKIVSGERAQYLSWFPLGNFQKHLSIPWPYDKEIHITPLTSLRQYFYMLSLHAPPTIRLHNRPLRSSLSYLLLILGFIYCLQSPAPNMTSLRVFVPYDLYGVMCTSLWWEGDSNSDVDRWRSIWWMGAMSLTIVSLFGNFCSFQNERP